MKRVAAKIGIVLLLFETTGSTKALLVPGGYIAGYGFSLSGCFGALQGDDVAWHKDGGGWFSVGWNTRLAGTLWF